MLTFACGKQIHLPAETSFISVLVLTWAGNDCDYLGWAETAESVFKSEPELRSGNNKNWCDLVTGGMVMVMVTMTGRGIMGHAPSVGSGKH